MSNSDSELEEDEEEILVHVEFEDLEPSALSNEDINLDILGIDSDHPIMQLNGKVYEGTYEDAIGTYLYFSKDGDPKVSDPVCEREVPSIKYFTKTRKVLKMQRAFLIPNLEVVGDSEHSKCIPNMETIKEAGVPPKYQEQALTFWENTRSNRINALNTYLEKQRFRDELRSKGFEPESESDEENPFAAYKAPVEIQLDSDNQKESENPLGELDENLFSMNALNENIPSTSHQNQEQIEDEDDFELENILLDVDSVINEHLGEDQYTPMEVDETEASQVGSSEKLDDEYILGK